MANVGQKAPNFNLRNANKAHGGETMSLDDARGENGTIVVFECNHCPYVIASIGRMEDMAVFAKQSNIGFIGINSNDPIVYANDDFEHMVKRADAGMGYPYLHDETQEIATAYGAKRTPEFYLLDSNDVIVYRGRMDDSPRDPSDVTTTELKDAVDAILAGNTPDVTQTESIGCSVKWKQ